MDSNKGKSIVNSALWAAAGDAIGWISELTDEKGLKRRIKNNYLHMPVSWERKIGGYAGVQVQLPAGTYSDDTQLRLSVSRSIRGNGEFDVESFAKIELPVWLSYGLGAGRATKAAATNLMKRDINWFSNFYNNENIDYTKSGGNGTAMRIQPHVWSCRNLYEKKYLTSIIKDSLVTHGHLLAVCGAVFHADALQYSILNQKPADINVISQFIDDFDKIPEIILSIYELKNFWLPTWEQISGKSLDEEIQKIRIETKNYLNKALNAIQPKIEPSVSYKNIISALDCDKESRRGTATNTALASSLLCYLFRDQKAPEAILTCVNLLGTDTDSIASMAGAILGCYNEMPNWDIQDSQYIIDEAIRLYNISLGKSEKSFIYPDLNKWQPPQTQSDSLAKFNNELMVVGLGSFEAIPNSFWETKHHSWQWVKLSYGQTILLKSKLGEVKEIDSNVLITIEKNQPELFSHLSQKEDPKIQKNSIIESRENSLTPNRDQNKSPISDKISSSNLSNHENIELDYITTQVIKNGFNHEEIGYYFIRISNEKGLEASIAYAAIISKAYIARKKR